jgi:hypothetical protein
VRASYKSLILAVVPWIVAYLTYSTFPLLFGGEIVPITEAGGFTIYHGIMDSAAIFGVSYILFRLNN